MHRYRVHISCQEVYLEKILKFLKKELAKSPAFVV